MISSQKKTPEKRSNSTDPAYLFVSTRKRGEKNPIESRYIFIQDLYVFCSTPTGNQKKASIQGFSQQLCTTKMMTPKRGSNPKKSSGGD